MQNNNIYIQDNWKFFNITNFMEGIDKFNLLNLPNLYYKYNGSYIPYENKGNLNNKDLFLGFDNQLDNGDIISNLLDFANENLNIMRLFYIQEPHTYEDKLYIADKFVSETEDLQSAILYKSMNKNLTLCS